MRPVAKPKSGLKLGDRRILALQHMGAGGVEAERKVGVRHGSLQVDELHG